MNRPGSALTRHKTKVSSTGVNIPVRNVKQVSVLDSLTYSG